MQPRRILRHPRSRVTRLAWALGAILVIGTRAHATEIAPPAPLTEDLGTLDGSATLARWLGDPPPAAGRLVSTSDAAAEGPEGPMIVGRDGRIELVLPSRHASGIPPLELRVPEDARSNGLYEIVRGADAPRWQQASLASLATDAHAGNTRFDVRPQERNPITLRTSVLDELTARVVRTPEPSTLALFALGLLGLAGALAGRRRAGS